MLKLFHFHIFNKEIWLNSIFPKLYHNFFLIKKNKTLYPKTPFYFIFVDNRQIVGSKKKNCAIVRFPQINYTIKISLYGCYPSGTHFKQFGSSIQTHLGTVLNPLTLGLFFTHHKAQDKHYITVHLKHILRLEGIRGEGMLYRHNK
jgi:hypothetical protein